MNAQLVRAYKQVMTEALDAGVTRQQVEEVVAALKDGTDPQELADALRQYMPYTRETPGRDCHPMVAEGL